MIRAAAIGLAVLTGLLGSVPASACPAPAPELLFHSCWGPARAELLLVPDEVPPPLGEADRRLTVTGVYTGRDTRPGGSPNPVGLFVDGGQVVNPTLARMDGVLLIEPGSGRATLHHRARVAIGGRRHDLTDPAARARFAAEAAAAGLSVAQSHLLIVDGRLDVRARRDAPRFVRRMLFEDAHGFGIWQGSGVLTLFEAAEAIRRALAPRMALNLDMGSYDYCRFEGPGGARDCAEVPHRPMRDYSNLIAVTWTAAPAEAPASGG